MSKGGITVIGLGLMGASIALAARRKAPELEVRGVDTDEETLAYAIEHGVVDEAMIPEAALEAGWFSDAATDMVVIATPPQATVGWLETLARSGYEGIVTDVASAKRPVVKAAREAERAGARFRFVGGHPMAGSEQSGIRAASDALFDDASYVLTPTDATDMDAYKRVHGFATSLGARVVSIDAEEHDEAVAIVSHVPHVTAAALVELASKRAEELGADLLRLGAGGFKDMTRIAAGSPDLWTAICLDNAEAISRGLERLTEVLGRFSAALIGGDATAVRAMLAGPAEVRRSLPARWVPATSRLRGLTVPVSDRPGVVGDITTAVSRAGCNIEDIEIDHRSEDTAVLRMVLTDEGDAEALLEDLRRRGYSPQLGPIEEG